MVLVRRKILMTVRRWLEEKVGEKVGEKVSRKGGQKRWVEKLAESQKKILELIKINPKISKKEMLNRIGINTTAIDKNIEKLKQKGLLKRIGPAKGGYWEIISNAQ